MNKSRKNILFGLACQLLGLVFFFGVWLMHFAIVFFTIGTIFFLFSKQKWYFKIMCLTPMFYATGIIVNALYLEKYIIPKDFTGVINVITDKTAGEKREYDFFTRIYRIPKSGVLFTKFNQKPGFNKRSFYQIDKNGNLKKLGILDHRSYIEKWVINPPKTEPSRDSLAVFTPELTYDSDSKSYNMVFTVGKYKEIKTWNYLPKEVLDSLRMNRER